jgi:hypothetical protein
VLLHSTAMTFATITLICREMGIYENRRAERRKERNRAKHEPDSRSCVGTGRGDP